MIEDGSHKNLIYTIQSDTNRLYLLGFVHVLAEKYCPLNRAFSEAYDNSQKVVFEIDPKFLFSHAAEKIILTYARLPKGLTLKTVLSPQTYHLLKKKFQFLGIDRLQVKRLKPWAVNLLVSRQSYSSIEFRQNLGIENYFFRKAKDDGKATCGLELLKDQIQVFDLLPMKIQVAMLNETLFMTDSKNGNRISYIW